MPDPSDTAARHAAAYDQLQFRFLHLGHAVHDLIRDFEAATGQILAVLAAQAEALAELAARASLDGTPIEELALGSREYGLLTRAGIHTVEQLTEMTEEGLHDLRNSGVKSVANIKQVLENRGLELKEAADG